MRSRVLTLVTAGVLFAAFAPSSGPALASAVRAATPHAATPHAVAPDTAVHWGEFFGDDRPGDTDPVRTPSAIQLPAGVNQTGTSNSTEYALLDNGTVWAWGQGSYGELGDGKRVNAFTSPVQVQFPPGVRIAFLPTDAMPFDGALAVDTSGNVWAWGRDPGGEFCLRNTVMYTKPTELPFTAVTTLAGADEHDVFDGVYHGKPGIWSCGKNFAGVLGNGRTQSSTTPVRVKDLAAAQVTDLVSSQDNAGALLADGQFYDWGRNAAGQLGDGTTANSSIPVPVSLPSPVTQVTQGGSNPDNGQTLVMLAGGAMYGWGNDSSGQLGDGSTSQERLPVRFFAPRGVKYATLISGGGTSYAITSNGDVYAWGAGGQWQIGDGRQARVQLAPVNVESDAAVGSATANNITVAGSLGFKPAARSAATAPASGNPG